MNECDQETEKAREIIAREIIPFAALETARVKPIKLVYDRNQPDRVNRLGVY